MTNKNKPLALKILSKKFRPKFAVETEEGEVLAKFRGRNSAKYWIVQNKDTYIDTELYVVPIE